MKTVTAKQIENLIDKAKIKVETIFEKCTLVTMQLENGFILVESSACVDKKNYDKNIGRDICLEKIRSKLWELEGYILQNKIK